MAWTSVLIIWSSVFLLMHHDTSVACIPYSWSYKRMEIKIFCNVWAHRLTLPCSFRVGFYMYHYSLSHNFQAATFLLQCDALWLYICVFKKHQPHKQLTGTLTSVFNLVPVHSHEEDSSTSQSATILMWKTANDFTLLFLLLFHSPPTALGVGILMRPLHIRRFGHSAATQFWLRVMVLGKESFGTKWRQIAQ